MLLRITLATLVMTALAACESTKMEEKRSDVNKAPNDATVAGELVIAKNGTASFTLTPPNSTLGLGHGGRLTPPIDDETDDEFSEEEMPEEEDPSSERIAISCQDFLSEVDQDDSAAPFATLSIGLEELDEDTIGYESVTFAYNCGRGAVIQLTDLNPSSHYRVSAEFYDYRGRETFAGQTDFFMPAISARTSLIMRRVSSGPPPTDVDVDVIFADDYNECLFDTIGCAEIYAPVECTVVFDYGNGGSTKFSYSAPNACSAKVELRQEACRAGAQLTRLACYPLIIDDGSEPSPPPPEPRPVPGANGSSR